MPKIKITLYQYPEVPANYSYPISDAIPIMKKLDAILNGKYSCKYCKNLQPIDMFQECSLDRNNTMTMDNEQIESICCDLWEKK